MVGFTTFGGGACGALTAGLELGSLLEVFGEQEAMSAVATTAAPTNVRSVRTSGRDIGSCRSVRLERAVRIMGVNLVDATRAVIDATGQVRYRVAASRCI
jgi:predicted amino acid dehydrogenase